MEYSSSLVLFSKENELTKAICNNIGESQKHNIGLKSRRHKDSYTMIAFRESFIETNLRYKNLRTYVLMLNL